MITRERLETMMVATGEFDKETHDDLQEIARLAIRGLETQWQDIANAPRDGSWFIAKTTKPNFSATRLVRFADPLDRLPVHGEGVVWPNAPTHFIPLSALGKMGEGE